MKPYSPAAIMSGVPLTVQGFPARTGPGGVYIPKTAQGLSNMSEWRNDNADAPNYWLRAVICQAFQRMIPLRMQDAPAADLIQVVAENWVEIVGEGMTEELARERVIAGFKLVFRECRRWPQPADLLKRLPNRIVRPQSGVVNVEAVDEDMQARSAEAIDSILESLG
jgi:hypothetical protein